MRNPDRQVVATGFGVSCHMGADLAAIVDRLRTGRPLPFEPWPPAVEYGARCQLLGICPDDLSHEALGVSRMQERFMGRAAKLALAASLTALRQAAMPPRELAVVIGSGTGDVATHRDIEQRLQQTHDMKRVPPTVIPRLMASNVSANLSTILGTTGPSFTATAACAGGAYNLLLAAELIEQGHIDAAIAGGVEVADPHFFAGFDSMRAYNSSDNATPARASRPYAADRAGFIFSEGVGVVVLETAAGAARRGVQPLGRLLGYGMGADGAGDMVAPSSEGAESCIRRALAHAGLDASVVDYINTHGTSTPRGDLSEIDAIRRVFGRHLAYSSTKGHTGHTVSAAGAIEAIFTWSMLGGGWLAPSVHADPLDPALADYPPILTPTEHPARIALSNSFGFGGTNATLVLGAP